MAWYSHACVAKQSQMNDTMQSRYCDMITFITLGSERDWYITVTGLLHNTLTPAQTSHFPRPVQSQIKTDITDT